MDQILAEVDETCAEHTKALSELGQLQLWVDDEIVALAVGKVQNKESFDKIWTGALSPVYIFVSDKK